ncbi:GNAT family N-acetyltransferase [Haloarchaeobius amylolyticus]|uniref:GNAT family N-acetyltransferase n=1 Tax=Haloarchaeobius amylolyticus TaxID=1198296 RepID=UPI002271ED39|nr:GNAT family protein [Haloarchaeobius amylolyticus]
MPEFSWDDGLFPARIETDRLVMTRVDADTDPLEFYRAFSREADPERVFAYVSPTFVSTPKRSHDLLRSFAEQGREGTAAAYVLRPADGEPDAGRFAGIASFRPVWGRKSAEVGVMLGTDFWGRGYSGERAGAFLELAFDHLDLELVEVTTRVGNENSQRAIERYLDRFGGQRDAVARNDETDSQGAHDVYRYTVSRVQYRQEQQEG